MNMMATGNARVCPSLGVTHSLVGAMTLSPTSAILLQTPSCHVALIFDSDGYQTFPTARHALHAAHKLVKQESKPTSIKASKRQNSSRVPGSSAFAIATTCATVPDEAFVLVRHFDIGAGDCSLYGFSSSAIAV